MSVDMYERRFREELMKLEPFVPNDTRDQRVWNAEFPAWRALFTSLCLWGHSTGYRLPSFDQFADYCEKAYCKAHPITTRFSRFFEGDLRSGMMQRIGAWYESGMAETYLYVCLVEAIEDKLKRGIVMYDPRADWKLKADVVVLMRGHALRVNSFVGAVADRPQIEENRASVERVRKVNTMESAHWGNKELEGLPELMISRIDSDCQTVNGVRLFSITAINRLLGEIYRHCGVTDQHFFDVRL
jgi:hypothetical protein